MHRRDPARENTTPAGRDGRGPLRRATALLLLLALASTARAETPTRWWVELPRASTAVEEVREGPLAPEPNARALERRARRGRPDRVAALQFGPRAEAVQRLRGTGVRVLTLSRWLCAASVEADADQLRALRREFGEAALRPVGRRRFDPDTVRLEAAPKLRAVQTAGNLAYGHSGEQIAQVQVDRLHALGYSGRDVRILVVDTGFVRSHSAFDSLRILDAWDFVFDDPVVENEAEDPAGEHNHGTGVLAVLAGRQEGELIGPAFGAEVLLAKTEYIASETRSEEDDFVAALEWGEARGIDLATASLGYRVFPDEPDSFAYSLADLDGDTAVTTRAVDDLVALGVVVFSAVGNSGPEASTLISPADSDSALAVGAVRITDVVATFSSRGPTGDGRIKPDLCARGVAATWAVSPEGYATASGTSVATPIAAGAAALLLEAHPEWGPGEVTAALRSTATQSVSPDHDRGWGIVQAFDAAFSQTPQTPLPFDLVEPPNDGHESLDTLVLRWRRGVDLQDATLEYRVRALRATDLTDTLLDRSVGADTLLVWNDAPVASVRWEVTATDGDGLSRRSDVRTLHVVEPVAVAPPPVSGSMWVSAPRPNPFNPRVSLRVELRRPGRLWAEVMDAAGRRVRRLRTGESRPSGVETLSWNGQEQGGRAVASGVYYLRLRFEGEGSAPEIRTERLVLVR